VGRRRSGSGAAPAERDVRLGEGRTAGEMDSTHIHTEGGRLAMAHHLGVRHKHSDSNGAPSPGAPLLTFFFGFLVASNNFLENDDQI
jgi:hypothetical protein